MYTFGERLRDLRIENGYKQDEIAKILNVTTSAYGYYEQGRNEPSLATLKKIANTFRVSTDYLLGLIDTSNHPVHYSEIEDLTLNELELQVIREMKKSLLKEIKIGRASCRERV